MAACGAAPLSRRLRRNFRKFSEVIAGKSWTPAAVSGDGKSIVISARMNHSGLESSRVVLARPLSNTPTLEHGFCIDVKPFTIRLNFFGDLGPFLGSNFRS